ncbi:hypothetical protein ACRQTN_07865 [Pectobacterium brasiliense]|uniref:hypothetical protein n=1 Tax=Pectobacterium brasiliense TaxID=180957 RepID=UPI003EB8B9D2
MNRDYTTLCFLMASMGLSHTELESIYDHIKMINKNTFINDIENVKKIMERDIYDLNKKNHFDELNYKKNISIRKDITSKNESNLIKKIEKKLIHDMGLNKNESAKLIMDELGRRNFDYKIPSYNKISFSNWLFKILNNMSESEFLHLIYSLDSKNPKLTDWNLKDE